MKRGVLDVAEDSLLRTAEEPHRAHRERLQDGPGAEGAMAIIEVLVACGETPLPAQAREPGGRRPRPREVDSRHCALPAEVQFGADDDTADLQGDIVREQRPQMPARAVPLGAVYARHGHCEARP